MTDHYFLILGFLYTVTTSSKLNIDTSSERKLFDEVVFWLCEVITANPQQDVVGWIPRRIPGINFAQPTAQV